MSPQRKPLTREQVINSLIRDHYKLDDEINTLINQANFDLYYGPSGSDDDFPGFTTAIRHISEALDDVRELWIDTAAEQVSESEPQWCEGCDDPECVGQFVDGWYHVDRNDVLTALVGRELVQYVS